MTWIELEGAVNTRDVGGLPTRDGRRVAYRKLLRSDNLQDLTDNDIKLLTGTHGVRTVVDLRTNTERASEGPGPLRAVDHVRHLDLSVLPEAGDQTDVAAEALASQRRRRNHERYPANYMTGLYLGYLEDRGDNVVRAIRAIANTDGAALVHCAAGKDRTGTVVALTLSAVDVEPDAVINDYARTAERIELVLDRLRATPTYSHDIDRIPVDAHRPRGETMEAFLEQLELKYGGAIGWLERHGFTDDEFERLRRRLVDES